MDLKFAWENGLNLSDAIFQLADEYQQDQFRNAKTRERSDALMFLMKEGLRLDLSRGQLIAIGFQVAPNVKSEPEVLPYVIFCDQDGIWSNSEISRTPWKYIAVRVMQPDIMHIPEKSDSVEEAEPAENVSKSTGRPPVSRYLDDLIGKLRTEAGFGAAPQKEQICRIGELAREQYPHVFKKAGSPARQTILKALARSKLTISSAVFRK